MTRKSSVARLKAHGVAAIPAGWKPSRVKYLGSYTNGYPFKPSDWSALGRPIIRIQDLSGAAPEPNRFEGELDRRYLIQTGEILISWSASLGVYRWTGREAWLNQHIFRVGVDHRQVHEEFFRWLAEWFIAEMDQEVHGSTMQHLTADAFGGFPVILPPQTRQRAIADYLDSETARIDALIAAKQRLIDLLDEKRRALVARAVTRGINPAAPLRDSGIPWLGEIPAHWEAERARWLFRERDQRSEFGQEELLTVSHITGVTPRSEKDVNMFEAETKEGYKLCGANDLVINTLWAWMGAMGVSPIDGIVSPAYNVYGMGERLDPTYVDAMVRLPAFAQEATRFSKGVWSSRLRLYPDGFFQIYLPVPPRDEQEEIMSHVCHESQKLGELRAAAGRTVTLLRERRAAVIAGAVTGQLDGREPLRAAAAATAGGGPRRLRIE